MVARGQASNTTSLAGDDETSAASLHTTTISICSYAYHYCSTFLCSASQLAPCAPYYSNSTHHLLLTIRPWLDTPPPSRHRRRPLRHDRHHHQVQPKLAHHPVVVAMTTSLPISHSDRDATSASQTTPLPCLPQRGRALDCHAPISMPPSRVAISNNKRRSRLFLLWVDVATSSKQCSANDPSLRQAAHHRLKAAPPLLLHHHHPPLHLPTPSHPLLPSHQPTQPVSPRRRPPAPPAPSPTELAA